MTPNAPTCAALADNTELAVHNHRLHPLASHDFSNSSSENRRTAHSLARARIARSFAGGSAKTAWNASANVAGDVAWKTVGAPSKGTTMSRRGPPEACATGIAPAACGKKVSDTVMEMRWGRDGP